MLLNHHRPQNCNYFFNFIMSSTSSNSRIDRILFPIGFLIVTCLLNLPIFSAQQSTSSSTVYQSLHIGTPVQKLLLFYNENPKRFHMYVGARNSLIRVDPQSMVVSEKFKTGPIKGSTECPPSPLPCPNMKVALMDSDCVNLFLMNVSSSQILLSCYSTNQGMCYVSSPTNQLSLTKILGDPSKVENYIASRQGSVVVSMADEFGAPKNGIQSTFYVAHAYDGRRLQLSPPAISKKKIVAPTNFAYWTDTTTAKSALDFIKPDDKQSQRSINYIYGFKYGGHVFFVKTELDNSKVDRKVTKLIRICIGDIYFGSYSEMKVECNGQTVATTATLGKMDDYLRNTFSSSQSIKSSDVLYMAFVNEKTSQNPTHSESRICAFSMDNIMSEFDNAKTACYARRTGNFIKAFADPKASCMALDQPKCQQNSNMYIEVTQTVDGYLLYGDKPRITSMVSMLQGSRLKYSLFIGTATGSIKKIVNGRDIFTVTLSSSKIEPDPAVESNEENIFLATSESLIKFPVKTCSYYRDCGSCIESQLQDNIECAWDGKSCGLKSSLEREVSYCEPIIVSFSPRKGPTNGGTILKVKGVDLGFHDESSNTENSISVGSRMCSIISWNYTDIACKIASTDEPSVPSSGAIKIQVKDISARKGYDIIGAAESVVAFNFVNPQITSVTPLISPLKGGVNVFIRGINLDCGSDLEVLLSGVKCESVQVIDSTAIECIAGSAEKQGYPTQGPIGVIIDSASLSTNFNFSYVNDPIFTYISPNVTSATSAVNITVIGDYLDSLYKPRLIVSAIVPKAQTSPLILASDCTPINSTSFTCPSPMMPPEIYFDSPITSTISFSNGGSSNHLATDFILVYLPDPKFSDKIVASTGLGGNRILEIMGQHLHTGYGMKVILVNQQDGSKLECKDLRSIDGNLIACNIPLEDYAGDPTTSLWNISVITGSRQLFVGSVPIEPELETESASTIAGIVVGMIAVLIVITLIMIYILKRSGYLVSSKKVPPSLGVTYRPENGPFQRQGSQNEYHPAGSRISGQPLLYNRQSEEIRFVVDPEKQSELMANGTLFSRDYLTREKVIGQGNFGLVYQGYLKLPTKSDEKIKVAIKTLKTDSRGILSQEKGEAFLDEGLIMKEFCHENVLSLIGVSIDFDGSPMIITPFMEHGDLRSYIQQEDLEFTVIQLIQFGVQVAQGMVYLSGLKFVHRDLAARNCMVDEFGTVKVADFGLSRDVYTKSYYSDGENARKPLPRKWMAIESLERGNYDTKSDVWSYGVLLWELLTRGDIPYPDVEDWKMKDYLKIGYRLPRPEHCPPEVYSVMKECWVENPKSRPTFEEILKLIEVAIESNEKKYLEQKTNRNIRYINDPSIFSNPEYDGMIVKS